MAHGNLEMLRRLFAAANTGDPEAVRELIDPEFEFAPHVTGGFEGFEYRGFEGLLSFIRVRDETWESMQVELSEVRENGDLAVALGTLRAQGRASGVEVEDPTVWMCRFRDGRIVRLEAHPARDPAQITRALAEAGLPPDAFDVYGESGETALSEHSDPQR